MIKPIQCSIYAFGWGTLHFLGTENLTISHLTVAILSLCLIKKNNLTMFSVTYVEFNSHEDFSSWICFIAPAALSTASILTGAARMAHRERQNRHSKVSKKSPPKQSMVLFVRLEASRCFTCRQGGTCNYRCNIYPVAAQLPKASGRADCKPELQVWL